MVTRAEAEVAVKSKVLYYLVYFGSFVLAVKIMPWIEGVVKNYSTNTIVIMIGSWLIAWIAALMLIPQVLFLIMKTMMED